MVKKSALVCFAMWLVTAVVPMIALAQTVEENKWTADNAASEVAIRSIAEEFVKAYNAHDAKAVAELFLPQAQIIDEADITIQGQENIQVLFANVFAENPETAISIQIESIRFIGTNLAMEMGTTKTLPPAGQTSEVGRYSVLHIMQDGKWSMGMVRDIPMEPTHRDHLESLAWLVGDWIDESRGGIVRTSCRWADNDSFLLQEITILQSNQESLKISQRIGWDPLAKQFKTWIFDSEGGYGESRWTPTETGWLIKATSVNSDATTASATHQIEPTGLDRYVFTSVDRVSGNELLASVQVIVVRQAPLPLQSESTATEINKSK